MRVAVLLLIQVLSLRAAEVPAGQTIQVRLETHLSSYGSLPGDEIRAALLSPVSAGGNILLPIGTTILGKVQKTTRIGRGWIHERASIDLDWTGWEDSDGVVHPLQAQLVEVDNAREEVTAKGRVKGILAAGGFAGLMHGTWGRPQWVLVRHIVFGLSRLSAGAASQVASAPISMGVGFGARLVLVRWPEPEIHFAPGTDMSLRLSAPLTVEGDFGPEVKPQPVPQSFAELATSFPVRTSKLRGQKTPDIVNLCFLGSREQITQSFAAAGWGSADKANRHSAMRAYHAITTQTAYPELPMATLLLDGHEPELMFQKSLNSMAKRHHVRLWLRPERYEGQQVWEAAATHDLGFSFSKESRGFTHYIDTSIDGERAKVIEDLNYAGCLDEAGSMERPNLARQIATLPQTDGRLYLLTLKPCSNQAGQANWSSTQPVPVLRGPAGQRACRRLLLEARYSILRGNVFYWGFRLVQHVRARDRASSQQTGQPQG